MTAEIRISGCKSRVLDITNRDSHAMGQLEEDLHAAHGRAGVVVHPFYAEERGEIADDYLAALTEFVVETATSPRPLIIFEEESALPRLTRLPVENRCFVVRTEPGDPTPAVDKFFIKADGTKQPDLDRVVMDDFVSDLQYAGLARTAIAGRLLWIVDAKNTRSVEGRTEFRDFQEHVGNSAFARPWVDNKLYPDGCVGGVIQGMLARNIPVTLSEATSPHTNRRLAS
jgi:hypothetical protein